MSNEDRRTGRAVSSGTDGVGDSDRSLASEYVMQALRTQVAHLALPTFGPLRVELMTRRRALTERDDELARAQASVAEDGLSAAMRLLLPDRQEHPLGSTIDAPYARLLPKLIQKED